MKGKDWSLWSEWSDPLQFTIDQSFSPNITYSYDEVGNRLTKTEGAQQTSYTYNNMNQLINDGTWAYTYDDNGNLIQKADGYNNFIYTYDYENRMIEVKWNGVTLQENFYDCCGKRIKMKNYNENGELMYITIYIYIGWNTIYEKTIYPDLTETETKYIYGASGHMAKITDTGTIETTTFYHTDVLGSVRQKTDSDGQALWVSIAIYKPFGGIYSGGPTDESETHLYTGKTYDYGTGLYYYGTRFYDPEVGRFVTKDPIKGDIGNPQTLNKYIFVLNNPLKYIDPSGMKVKEITKEPPPSSDTDTNAGGTTMDGEGGDSEGDDVWEYTSTVGNITVTYSPTGITITVTNPDGSTESVTLSPDATDEEVDAAQKELNLNEQEKENLANAIENVFDQMSQDHRTLSSRIVEFLLGWFFWAVGAIAFWGGGLMVILGIYFGEIYTIFGGFLLMMIGLFLKYLGLQRMWNAIFG